MYYGIYGVASAHSTNNQDPRWEAEAGAAPYASDLMWQIFGWLSFFGLGHKQAPKD